jgi:hypothetical protein
VVPEAPLERTEHGLTPGGDGWFVLNAREARWWDRGELGADVAYARFPEAEPTRYRDGWLPG